MKDLELYKLKNGETRWKFRLYLGIEKTTGKEIDIHRQGFKTKNEALLEKTRIENEYRVKDSILPAHARKEKFSIIAEKWLEQYKRSVKENTYVTTVHVYEKHIEPYFGDLYVDQITPIKCQEVVNLWYETYTKSANLVSISSRIMKLAILWDYCKTNPFDLVIRPKNTHKEHYHSPFYDREQLNYFFDCINKEEDIMNITMFRILAYTGVRKAELYGLMWSDIDEINQTLSIQRVLARGNKRYVFQDPKTESSRRVIDLDKQTYKMLMQWKKIQRERLLQFGINSNKKNQLIFTREKNLHLGSEYLNGVLKRIIKKYNLPYITIHGFRHSHCSLLFDAGIDKKNVQARLGHASIITTINIYNHVTKYRRKETADKFAKFLEL